MVAGGQSYCDGSGAQRAALTSGPRREPRVSPVFGPRRHINVLAATQHVVASVALQLGGHAGPIALVLITSEKKEPDTCLVTYCKLLGNVWAARMVPTVYDKLPELSESSPGACPRSAQTTTPIRTSTSHVMRKQRGRQMDASHMVLASARKVFDMTVILVVDLAKPALEG